MASSHNKVYKFSLGVREKKCILLYTIPPSGTRLPVAHGITNLGHVKHIIIHEAIIIIMKALRRDDVI